MSIDMAQQRSTEICSKRHVSLHLASVRFVICGRNHSEYYFAKKESFCFIFLNYLVQSSAAAPTHTVNNPIIPKGVTLVGSDRSVSALLYAV